MMLTQNAKMKRSSKRVFNFGIPAFRSQTGFKTCPMAGACVSGCYAKQGFYVMPQVKAAQETRLVVTQSPVFGALMALEIAKVKPEVVRVHDSGDFYSKAYAEKWIDIALAHPAVGFYAYTKMVEMTKELKWPKNFTLIYSYGGLEDKKIGGNDRNSRVFESLKALKAAKYVDSSHDDMVALGKSKKIGLIYHGSAKRNKFNNKETK